MNIDWDLHQRQLDDSGESIKSYCDRLNLKYGTARNRLKKRVVNSEKLSLSAKQNDTEKMTNEMTKKVTKLQGVTNKMTNEMTKLQCVTNKMTNGNYGNINALKHGGYARKYAQSMLEGGEYSDSFEREIAIFEQQVNLLLRQQIEIEQEGNKELLMRVNEALNRTTSRLMALKIAQQRFKKSVNGNLDLINNLLKKKDNEELTATDVAYKLTKRGIDIPAILMLEVKAEQSEYDEEEYEIPSFNYHDIVKREEELRNEAKQKKEEFLAQRRKELAALDV